MAKSIPLIGAGRIADFCDLLDAVGVPANRHLHYVGLSPLIRESPAGFIPGRSAWALIGEATHSEGLRDLCLDIARLSDWRRAAWVPPLSRAAILGDAIRAMCSSYVREIPMVRLGLAVNGPLAWFWRRRVGDVRGWDGNEPAEQYMLSFMLAVIRAAAGPEWLPEHLKVESASSGWASVTSGLPGVRIQYDQPLLAVAIPTPLLSTPIAVQARPEFTSSGDPPPDDFQGSLRQVLQHWLPGGPPTEHVAAAILGMSERTLRRRLKEDGTTWRAVVQDVVFAQAVTRLQEARASVRQIAQELGYSDAAHFTRFFRSRAGLPPGAFREQIEHARELARQVRP